VRITQNGNALARDFLYKNLLDVTNDWIYAYKSLHSWIGYDHIREETIQGCMKRFRYAGSFAGYLFRTLQYAGLGLRPLEAFSLDEPYNG